ncbi:Ig-like domain-containing protein [Nocardia sp. NPDC051052]|uniref:phage tail tube protein n=1 Tax=Nocardia sp. NPDC051052 TaxID=3364322 RepID=UPI00379180D0
MDFALLKKAKAQLLLKPLDAVIFLAPWYTAAPAQFTDATTGLQTLPTTYNSVGLISKKDGIAFARNIETGTIDSFGELEPTRMDITGDSTTLSFTPQETNKTVLQLTTGADLSAATANADSGEVFFAQPSAPQVTFYSCIVIGRDGDDTNPIYVFKVLPKVALSKADGETWSKDSSAAQKITLTAFRDATAGYSVGHGFGGRGWKRILQDAGFDFKVTAITVTPTTLPITAGADSNALVVKDQALNVIPNSKVAFTTSADNKATVTTAGVVHGVAAGTATITATYQGKTSICTVTVA